MSFINSIIKVFVGDKSQTDVKNLQPYLTKIKTFENTLSSISNDEL
jgi:preprotein translocase subunit SecA